MKKVEELVFEPMGLISGPVLTVMFDGLPRVKGPRPPPPHTQRQPFQQYNGPAALSSAQITDSPTPWVNYTIAHVFLPSMHKSSNNLRFSR